MENKKRRVSLSIRESLESTGLLLICIKCGEDLLDSGSDNNCIDIASFSDKMHLLEKSNNILNLYGMEGNGHACDRRILHLGDDMKSRSFLRQMASRHSHRRSVLPSMAFWEWIS